jgi:hypothetical protein
MSFGTPPLAAQVALLAGVTAIVIVARFAGGGVCPDLERTSSSEVVRGLAVGHTGLMSRE